MRYGATVSARLTLPFRHCRSHASDAVSRRWNRLAKNARWYLLQPGWVGKVGWGDFSYENLRAVADLLSDAEAFVVLPENPPGGQHLPGHDPAVSPPGWCWYDRPDDEPGPTAVDLANAAIYAVIGTDISYVDTCGSANRAGNMWISPGYRYTSTGPVISRAKIRFTAITSDDLADRLDQLVANNDVHSVTAWEHP